MPEDFDFRAFAGELEERLNASLAPGRNGSTDLKLAALQTQRAAEEALKERPFPSRVACGPGCGHCCVVNVAVLEPEAALVVDFLRRTCSVARQEELREKLAELFRKIRWLEEEDRPLLRAPCAFLDEQERCSIHPVRPLLCRSVTSTDPRRCREAIALLALGEPPTVLSDLFQARLFREAFLALGRSLEKADLEPRSRPLTEAVLTALDS